ncbi:tRNA lysidine(34) synthetase TilS [bacterium]|nr:tRNA lysidine(34) synthetase TilS [bacterium]
MKNTVKTVISKYIDITCESTIIVGFSGGWDSMCLLDIMKQLRDEEGFLLIAAHLNHNWRGEESEREKERCREFCEKNDITFVSQTLPEDTKESEAVAREYRYNFFMDCAEEFQADVVLTAHTKSDNAETILYRIIKGTGLNGLEGIRELRELNGVKIIRPILNFTRKDIENYCITHELFPNSDTSNLNTKYARNNIRHNIMPAIKTINSNIENSLITLAEIASGNNKIINELMQTIKDQITLGDKWLTQNFLILNSAMKQHFVYNLLLEYGLDPSYAKIQEIVNFIVENQSSKTGKTLSITSGTWLFTSHKYTYIYLEAGRKKIAEELKIEKEGEYTYADTYKVKITQNTKEIKVFPKSISNKVYVDLSQIGFPLTLRTRKTGDIIQPFGMKGKMKLKKYFINKNIPSHDRDLIPLLCKGNEVLWAVGVGVSEKLRAGNIPTHKIKIEKQV